MAPAERALISIKLKINFLAITELLSGSLIRALALSDCKPILSLNGSRADVIRQIAEAAVPDRELPAVQNAPGAEERNFLQVEIG